MIRQTTLVPDQVVVVELPDGNMGLSAVNADNTESLLIVMDKATAAGAGKQLAGIAVVIPPAGSPFGRPNGGT